MSRMAVVVVALVAPGCGTLVNTTRFFLHEGHDHPVDDIPAARIEQLAIYGGIRSNIEVIKGGEFPGLLISLIDFPISLVADTILLPLTIPYSMCADGDSDPDSDRESAGDVHGGDALQLPTGRERGWRPATASG